jgi:hypothetical protein
VKVLSEKMEGKEKKKRKAELRGKNVETWHSTQRQRKTQRYNFRGEI